MHTHKFLLIDKNYIKYELHNYNVKNNACIFYEINLQNRFEVLILHNFKLLGENLCVCTVFHDKACSSAR